ncbi:uncharacterized protein LOC113208447 [Frankliniella occidentalis]|uniref:Uncharacterized protein LOC113208447 n=1 Tax=Frankliniella occidentalis TaxID=133901 RepID=A0A6J1SRW7_FRAOC|nr:uncharacterized protein LOC113208447 [Frankliniella occidentalis]
MKLRTSLYLLAVGMLVLSLLVDDVDARRKVLRGRKAITRTYYRGTAIPSWSIALLVGIAMLAAGGGVYAGMSKYLIGNSENDSAA